MSLNISGSKYVKVYDPSMRLDYSDKVIFANLVTSRKTGNVKLDETTGNQIAERAYSRWEGRFMGNALEAAKGLRSGAVINIINGWIVCEPYKGRDGKEHYRTYANIIEFESVDVGEGVDDESGAEDV